MAVTISTVLNGGGAPSGGASTTASWTPDGTSQYLLTVSAYVSTGSAVPVVSSVTGNGLTWTLITFTNGDNTGADRTAQYLYVVPAGGSAGAITINWSTVPGVVSWVLDKVAGANSAVGSGTLVQPAVSATSSGANPSATLANALASGSVSYAAACFESSAGTLSAGTGYTALGQNTSQSLAWSFTEWNSAGSTTAAANNSTVSNRHSIILIEVGVAVSSNNWTQSPTDNLGLTDSAAVSRVLSQASADTEGLSDGGSQLGHLLSGSDPESLADLAALTQTKGPTDSLGLTDSVVVTGAFKYLTAASSNGRYFVDQNGSPFLVRGDSPWALPVKLSSSEVDTYLANRVSKGVNTLLMSIIGNTVNGGPNDNGATYDGVLPFTGGDPTVFNSTYWSRMDSYLAKIRDAGLSVMIYPIDGWTTLSGGVFDPATVTTTQAQTYGNNLATRYPASTYPNIVWGFGGDYSETTTLNNLMGACLTGIRAAGDTRLVTVQLMYETSESDNSTYWEPKVSWDFVYEYRVTYKGVSDGYNHTWSVSPTTKPALFSEGAYEGSTDANHPGTDLVIRRQAAWALTSGSPGEFTGQEGVWNFTGSWSTLLNSTATSQLKAIRDAIQGVAWWTLVPDDANQLVTAGRGTRVTTDAATYPTGNTYVTAGRAADGSLAVIYLPNASSTITVDMTKIGANPVGTWVDPTNGATSSATIGSTYSKGNNAAGSTDWLLILTGDVAANWTQTPSDTVGLSDVIASAVGKALLDAEGLADVAALLQGKATADNEGLTDSVLIEKGLLQAYSDTEGLTDSAATSLAFGQVPVDAEALTDSITQVLNYNQTPVDQLGLTDTAQTSLTSAGSVNTTDNLSVTDGVVVDQAHALIDAEGVADATAFVFGPAMTDPEALTDLASPVVGRVQQPTDLASMSDAVSVVSSGSVAVADGELLVDVLVVDQAHAYGESAALSDAAMAVLAAARAIVDSAALADAAAVQLNPVVDITPRPNTGRTHRPDTGTTPRP